MRKVMVLMLLGMLTPAMAKDVAALKQEKVIACQADAMTQELKLYQHEQLDLRKLKDKRVDAIIHKYAATIGPMAEARAAKCSPKEN